jgi:hypothetical protein
MTDNPLFRDRVPEAAANQLAVVLAWATECALATVEQLEHRKRVSKRELARHQSIANELVAHCRELNVAPHGLGGAPCPRLEKLLNCGQTSSWPLDGHMDAR